MAIQQTAVIGSGVMGSGIAAQLANAGLPVLLLDIVPKDAENRSILAETALARLVKTEPAPLMHPSAAKRITPGNLDDDLAKLGQCDLIIEAVLEDIAVKRALYARLEPIRKAGSIIASNTSTIPLAHLTEGLPPRFAEDFLITHFFNPPRYMRLLELVRGEATRQDAVDLITDFADRQLGKGVVLCRDRPGFIANRIGTFWMQSAVNAALAQGLTVEEADAIMGKPLGLPKTGIFGLIDLVGLDLIPKVAGSLQATLPAGDAFQAIARTPDLFKTMIAGGLIGRKGKGGFYRLDRKAGTGKEAIDLKTGQYRPTRPALLDSAKARDPAALLAHPDAGGEFARRVMVATLAYVAGLIPELTADLTAIDQAMRLGYNWQNGPFELMDRIGVDRVIALCAEQGIAVPPLLALAQGRSFYREQAGALQILGPDGTYHPVIRPEGVLLLADIKRRGPPLDRSGSAALWDIGDGVACLEFTSKMNTLDPETLALLARIARPGLTGLVIYNEGENFSVGANIGLVLFAANIGAWSFIEAALISGQTVLKGLKYAPFPVVAAPFGLTLGGATELCLHADAVQAHAETYMGLVEVGVGIVPGWGGHREMLQRLTAPRPGVPAGPMPGISAVFETISTAKVSRSAEDARGIGYLREGDSITMNRDRLLFDAKAKVLALAAGYTPPVPGVLHLPGATAATGFGLVIEDFRRQGKATKHDVTVAREVAGIVAGGATDMLDEISEDAIDALERQGFMRLIRTQETLARLEHMLETGKPLRN